MLPHQIAQVNRLQLYRSYHFHFLNEIVLLVFERHLSWLRLIYCLEIAILRIVIIVDIAGFASEHRFFESQPRYCVRISARSEWGHVWNLTRLVIVVLGGRGHWGLNIFVFGVRTWVLRILIELLLGIWPKIWQVRYLSLLLASLLLLLLWTLKSFLSLFKLLNCFLFLITFLLWLVQWATSLFKNVNPL